jgi:hypothetical protein
MATDVSLVDRLLVAGGFAFAVAAAPVVAGLATPAGPASHAVAECPNTESINPATGACQPPSTSNPISPKDANLQPGGMPQATPAPRGPGELPSFDGVPCTPAEGCLGLEQSKGGNNVQSPMLPVGAPP